jgi:hypothetical protein
VRAGKFLPLIMLLSALGHADKKPQFVLEVTKAVQTEQVRSYYVPGTPSQSRTACSGTSTDTGTTTSTLNADCTTTTTPGSAPYSGTRLSYSEDIRVIMPDGSHLTLWCQEGFRRCIHLAPKKYWAEQEKDTVWIYCTYADQEQWDETGMSPGERKANHEAQRVKYRVVGTWGENKNAGSDPSKSLVSKPKGLDPGLLAWSTLTTDTSAAGSSFDLRARTLQADEVRCGEPWFGEALVCKAGDTSVVVGFVATQPLREIYQFWLGKISDDFVEFKRISALDCQDKCDDVADFIKDSEKAYYEDGSVWMKLRTAYCKGYPSGGYPDLSGLPRSCGN